MKELYQEIANALNARKNCEKIDKDHPHIETWNERIQELNSALPHGSGIDGICKINEDSTDEKIIINFEYHFMNSLGFYNGWESYTLTIKPSFVHGFSMNITGKNKDGIKDYFYQIFADCLHGEDY